MPERGDDCPCAEANIFCLARHIDQAQERVGRDCEIHPMMLASPDRMHAALISHLRQRQKILIKLALVLIGADALHMHKERKPHEAYLS